MPFLVLALADINSFLVLVDVQPEQQSREVEALIKRRAELETDQISLVTLVTSSFVDSLVPGRSTGHVRPSLLDKVIDNDHSDDTVWDTVARLGWYREFMRSVRRTTGITMSGKR
jgi:hypothetical protein